jgi:hypothetical protein
VWASHAQVYRWDNVGFDGPILPRTRGYDVADRDLRSNSEHFPQTDIVRYGYELDRPLSLSVAGVDPVRARRAVIDLNAFMRSGRELRYRINGGEQSTFTVPSYGDPDLDDQLLRSLSIEVPLSAIGAGTNTIELSLSGPGDFEMVGNLDLSLLP